MTGGKRKRQLIGMAKEAEHFLNESAQMTVGFRHLCSDCGEDAEPLRLMMRSVRDEIDDAVLKLHQLRVELGDAEVL